MSNFKLTEAYCATEVLPIFKACIYTCNYRIVIIAAIFKEITCINKKNTLKVVKSFV